MRSRGLIIIFAAPILFALCTGCGQNKNPSTTETNVTAETAKSETSKSEVAENDADSKGKPLGVKSGIIEYSYSGDKTGKSTQYFDDYGMKSAVYAEIVQQGEESKGWALTLGEDQYMWDLAKPGTGMKAKNPMAKMMMESSGKGILSYMATMYAQMGMTESGTETFQGKGCTVFKGDLGKVLIWKGILMKTEINIGTLVSRQEVTSIKTNVPVDGKYFRIPDNITFSEIPGF